MEKEKKEALAYLTQLAQKKGYLLFDDILDSADKYDLPIQDVDWLSSSIAANGILVYDKLPQASNMYEPDEFDDFSQTDYEAVFDKVIDLSPNLKPFIDEVRKIRPPQYGETAQLKFQVREGNQFARQRMIEMHLRLAVKIALQRAETFNIDIEEVVGDAYVGLIMAVDKYDPEKNGPFLSYASLWISQNINRQQGTCRPLVYYPVHKKECFYSMYPILKSYGCIDCHDFDNCLDARIIISKNSECTESEADDVVTACMPIDSLEELIRNAVYYDKHNQLKDKYYKNIASLLIYSDNMYEIIQKEQLRQIIIEILDQLTVREKNIIYTRYGFDDGQEKTLAEVGRIFGLSRERIRQIELKVLNKLAHGSWKNKLKWYL